MTYETEFKVTFEKDFYFKFVFSDGEEIRIPSLLVEDLVKKKIKELQKILGEEK